MTSIGAFFMRRTFSIFSVAIFLLSIGTILSACGQAPSVNDLQESLLKDFAKDTLSIEKANGEVLEFAVYVAQSDEEMRQGLMFVKELDPRTGMLFKYKRRREASMWMKNTLIPLDIFFIKSDGIIANVAENTTPKSLKSIPSDGPVRGALELTAGSAKKYGLAAGDRVIHAHFGKRQ